MVPAVGGRGVATTLPAEGAGGRTATATRAAALTAATALLASVSTNFVDVFTDVRFVTSGAALLASLGGRGSEEAREPALLLGCATTLPPAIVTEKTHEDSTFEGKRARTSSSCCAVSLVSCGKDSTLFTLEGSHKIARLATSKRTCTRMHNPYSARLARATSRDT